MRLLALLALCGVAEADVAVVTPAPAERCNFADSRHYTDAMKFKPRQDLYFGQRGAAHVLWSNDKRSEVTSADAPWLSKSPVLRLATNAAALVERGDALVGVLALDSTKHEVRLYDASGAVAWRTPMKNLWADSAAAVLDDTGGVIVAIFHRIATGSSLMRFDLKTGAITWTADVVQLNVAHSKYYNDVEVALSDGIVTLRGTEAGGCYLQTFDAKTGKRLSSRIFGR